MKKIFKIGYIGNGPISNFHVPALKANKFKIEIFYYRKNSKLAKNFINKHQIKNSTTNLDLFYSKSITECDAMVICVKTEFVCQYLRKFANYKKPVLVEKPGAINYTDLYSMLNNERVNKLKLKAKIKIDLNVDADTSNAGNKDKGKFGTLKVLKDLGSSLKTLKNLFLVTSRSP